MKVWECHAHTFTLRFLRNGDFVTYHGELAKVVTIQRDCLSMTRRQPDFTMVTLQTRDGKLIPARDLVGKITVLRGKVLR